ncbi:MAG: hypothetical protein AAF721_11310 [Myxococcota bacterium]
MKCLVITALVAAIASPAAVVFPTQARAAEPGSGDGGTAEKVETVEAVDVKLKIKAGNKKVGELAGIIAWDQAAELAMSVDGHEHVTSVTVHKGDAAGRKLKVQLGYQLDGKAILDTIEVDAAASRKKIVKSSDGAIAIALTLAPKQVSPDTIAPTKPSHHIEFETDSNDPLAGLD